MKQTSACPLCGYEKVGKHCICEFMTRSERIVWKETGQIPKHLSGYTLEDLEAEEEEVRWWYEV